MGNCRGCQEKAQVAIVGAVRAFTCRLGSVEFDARVVGTPTVDDLILIDDYLTMIHDVMTAAATAPVLEVRV